MGCLILDSGGMAPCHSSTVLDPQSPGHSSGSLDSESTVHSSTVLDSESSGHSSTVLDSESPGHSPRVLGIPQNIILKNVDTCLRGYVLIMLQCELLDSF